MDLGANLPNDKPLPSLKYGIEAVQIEHEGQPMVMFRDGERLTENTVAVPLPVFFIAMMLNGQTTVADIQSAFTKGTRQILSAEEINGVIQQLDKYDLLETPALKEKRQRVLQEFASAPIRKAAHVGGVYPENSLDLAVQLGQFFKDPKGPGKELPSTPGAGVPPLGLISPHIDFARGGPAYAWAYQALADAPAPDLVVALGVAHPSPNSPWVFTRKSYETPYGPMSVDEGLYDEVRKSLWYDPVADEWAHRLEHSLEFQALWLKYIWRDKTPPWLPILCSTFERFCPDKAPSTVPTIEKAIVEIGETLLARQKKGQKILILAGIDLAHVGPRFGDDIELTPELEKKIEDEDRKSLEKAMSLDADGFYLSVVADDHWRKVCGLSALYTSLRWMRILNPSSPTQGRLLTYGQAPDPMGGIVSFASAIFPERN